MIGIIGAMEEEVNQLKENMEDIQVKWYASMEFTKGKLCKKDVMVVRSGIGKVNAGICAQILVDKYDVDIIINTGIAGSLDASIDIGDIVISIDALQHDVDAREFGYDPCVIPRMKTSIFLADAHLATLAKEACEQVNADIKVFLGRVVSGDQFIADKQKKKWLKEQFNNPLCTEMEGAAIAQVAYLNQIPFLIIRAISDKADDSAKMDYPAFEAKAIEHTVKLMMQLLSNL